MKVPIDFMQKVELKEKNDIYLKRYEENVSSKIYTQVLENLLVIVLKGKKQLIYQEYELTIEEGQFALFTKGHYIMNQIISEEGYESLLIFLSDDLLRNLPLYPCRESSYDMNCYHGDTSDYMKNEVNALLNIMNSHDNYDKIIYLKIIELLLHIDKEDNTGVFRGLIHSFVQSNHFAEDVTCLYKKYHNIQEISESMHISKSTFKRKFQQSFGCTPHHWVNEQRLQKAVILLDTSDYSITDIGFICGYESLSAFMKQFKKKYGISPGKYKIQNRRTMKQ